MLQCRKRPSRLPLPRTSAPRRCCGAPVCGFGTESKKVYSTLKNIGGHPFGGEGYRTCARRGRYSIPEIIWNRTSTVTHARGHLSRVSADFFFHR
ncbi:hypothetical protein Y032_0542g3212 [Ancylostoma ceylanicum]|nr:hypothetical protein Y032_0542g3212 [Ancylostoma ceylanicum]